jgi:hypothetical protein
VALGTCGEGDGSSDDEDDDKRAVGGTGCTDALIRSRNAMASSLVVPSASGANGLTVGDAVALGGRSVPELGPMRVPTRPGGSPLELLADCGQLVESSGAA